MNAQITRPAKQDCREGALGRNFSLGSTSLLIVALLLGSIASTFAGKIKYTYDSAGRLVAADHGSNVITTLLYDLNGNLLNRSTAVPTNADVRLAKTSNFTGITVGNNITFTLTVTNAGPNAATDVIVTDPLPFGVLFSSASASQGSVIFSNRSVIGDVGILPAGGSVTLTFLAFHGLTNSATNIAMVAAATPDPNLGNNTGTRVTSGLGPISDSDTDGMPNWWETLNGLNPFQGGTSVNGANGNPDGDGVRNFQEWLADTRPNDSNSFFVVTSVQHQPGNPATVTLFFQSSPLRRYFGQSSDSVAPTSFTNFTSTNNGTGLMMSLTDTNALATNRFYRVGVQIP